MAIDTEIYKKGISGNLSAKEIDDLPKDYGILKSCFKHAAKEKKKLS